MNVVIRVILFVVNACNKKIVTLCNYFCFAVSRVSPSHTFTAKKITRFTEKKLHDVTIFLLHAFTTKKLHDLPRKKLHDVRIFSYTRLPQK